MTATRSLLFDIYLALITAIMGIFFLPALVDRRAARVITRLWARTALAGLHVICGLRHRIEDADLIPTGPAIVAANHQSMWETIALLALLPRPAVVFKKELLRVPVYGWWAMRTGVPVDRGAGVKALRMLRRETERHIKRGDQIVVFPEGTRGLPGALGQLQPGVAGMYLIAEAPVTPAIHNSGEFCTHPRGLKTAGVITIRFLPAIAPNKQRREFMAELESALKTNAGPSRA